MADFHHGDRVRMSAVAKAFRHRARTGRVYGEQINPEYVRVRRDGTTSAETWWVGFWEPDPSGTEAK